VLKLYDWRCNRCGAEAEHFIKVADGDTAPLQWQLPCGCADVDTPHVRLASPPAKYMGDRIMAPRVYGGRNDTAGYKPVPDYPELRDGVTYEEREIDGRVRKAKVVKASALIDHQNTPQWKEVHREREAICDENAVKRARLPALKAGKVDLRNSKLPGDPKLTEKRKATTHAR